VNAAELAYLRMQVEELAAENLRLARRSQIARAQLGVSRRGLGLLDRLGGSLGGSTELEPALAAVLPALAAGLQVQRAVALRRVGRHFAPFAWNGYDAADAAPLSTAVLRLGELGPSGGIVVAGDTPGDGGVAQARAVLGVPAFVAVSVADGSHALLVARLDERGGFFPRFTADDANALGAVASVVAGTVANARTAALNEMRRFLPPTVVAEVMSGRMTAAAEHSHREVTLLAVDLVGSTRLVERLRPEVLSRVLDAYLRELTSIAHGHGGTVGSVAGDGLLVLFGAPEEMAGRDQVRCALDAAFAMRARAAALGADLIGEELQVRVGVNRGRCAVGVFGSDSMRTYTAIGRPVHLAARLESAASPGEVLIGPAVLEHARGVSVQARGELTLKGFDAPVPAHAAIVAVAAPDGARR
jgi:class 3 adenylate cyclase